METIMDDLNFTEEEILEQLEILGYHNVPPERLKEFKRDLEQLMKHERSRNSSWSSGSSSADTYTTGTDSGSYGRVNQQTWRPPLEVNNQENRASSSKVSKSSIELSLYGKENGNNLNNCHTAQVKPVLQSFPDSSIPTYPKTVHIPFPLPVRENEEEEDREEEDNECISENLAQTSQDSWHYKSSANERERIFSVPTHGPNIDIRIPGQEMDLRHDNTADDTLDTTGSSERRQIKRKVLRKQGGHVQIFDETVTESESDMSNLYDQLAQMRIPEEEEGDKYVLQRRPWSAPSQSKTCPVKRPQSAPTYRLSENYDGPKSLIRPMISNPHTSNIRKSDPVARYQQYRQNWCQQKAPGEKSHKNLRWSIREQMLYHDEVVQKKQHKVFVPNNYVIPSDKKRKALRWQIRNDLAQGIKPPSVFD